MTRPVFFVGDIHLGRIPHRLRVGNLNPLRLGPEEAWRRTVDRAIEEGAQAVVLAGDVVDQDKDRFEAWSVLHQGVEKLVAAGVRIMGVAGNHDHLALPRLATRIPNFQLLGRGGRWERVELDGLDIVGWSFPNPAHRASPLDSPGLGTALESRRPEVPCVGVLHADLDATASPYAPVQREALLSLDLDAWLLGHIHKPSPLEGPRPIGYLGSLVGLDRAEQGLHGPCRLSVGGPGAIQLCRIPVGPVSWSTVTLDTSEISDGDDALDRLHSAIARAVATRAQAMPWLADGDISVVGVSLSLVGRCRATAAIRLLQEQVRAARSEGETEGLLFPVNDVTHVIVAIDDRTRPALDLEALANQPTPVGRLARLLLDLDHQGEAALPDAVRTAIDEFNDAAWLVSPAGHPPPSPIDVTRRAAFGLLDQLLAQSGGKELS